MQKSEYWVLESVAENRRLLATLRPDIVEEAFNKEGHGLNDAQLISLLNGLFQQGYLYAASVHKSEFNSNENFVPSEYQICNILADEQNIWYGLTDYGASIWENLSHPDWQRFMFSELNCDTGQCLIAAGGEQIINHYLSRSDVLGCIMPDTLVRETMKNWQATYWKTLPMGYTGQFIVPSRMIEDFPYTVSENWYTNPFQSN